MESVAKHCLLLSGARRIAHSEPTGCASHILARMLWGVTKGDIVFVVAFVLLLFVQPFIALVLAVVWAIAFVARRRRKN